MNGKLKTQAYMFRWVYGVGVSNYGYPNLKGTGNYNLQEPKILYVQLRGYGFNNCLWTVGRLLWYVFSFSLQVVNEPADAHCPVVEMSTLSKLSCLSWNKFSKNQIASSDYEGIVTVWDVTTRQVIDLMIYDMLVVCFSTFLVFALAYYTFLSPHHFLTRAFRVSWSTKSMKRGLGVLIFRVQNLQCLYLVVMTARYVSLFEKFYNFNP